MHNSLCQHKADKDRRYMCWSQAAVQQRVCLYATLQPEQVGEKGPLSTSLLCMPVRERLVQAVQNQSQALPLLQPPARVGRCRTEKTRGPAYLQLPGSPLYKRSWLAFSIQIFLLLFYLSPCLFYFTDELGELHRNTPWPYAGCLGPAKLLVFILCSGGN